jgi:hypothetical protein
MKLVDGLHVAHRGGHVLAGWRVRSRVRIVGLNELGVPDPDNPFAIDI